MSLLDEFTESFYIMEKTRVSDGLGGYSVTWTNGTTIKLAQKFDESMQAKRAEKEGVKSLYTFLAPIGCGLDYHDVLKRQSDDQIFRVTSHSGESKAPASSTLKLTSLSAERWELTT